jgi:hypothetical protein
MKPKLGFLVTHSMEGKLAATERHTCPGCNLNFGGAEEAFSFQGRVWHKHCLIALANKRLKVLDPKVRIRNWRVLSNRIIDALREVAAMATSRKKALADFIQFCVDFLRDAAENPNAIPAEFLPKPATT